MKGKFRSFLLAALNHFLSDEWDKDRAEKRGGGQTFISLDDESAEERYRLEPVSNLTADAIFERRWALTLLEQALQRLRAEFAATGKANQFDRLKTFLEGAASSGDYNAVASELKMTAGAVAVAVHRLRQRYRELVRREIAQTVASPTDIDDEMRHLFAVLSGSTN